MGRPSYVCTICSEYFTRKYSAKRHNQNLHNSMGEIVILIDYLAGRSSGQYTPNNPFWYKRNNPYHNFGSATVADSVDDTFQPKYISQQTPLGISQYYTSSMYRPLPTMDEQRYDGLSQDTIQKADELKRLAYKYPQYLPNPDGIIRLAIFNSINGDNQLLDQMLEQFRRLDSHNA
ncbi:MAG: hypothetical protein WBF33_33775 [Candidatus Nitrosopolaris sp.]